jgi:hypothetical protein
MTERDKLLKGYDENNKLYIVTPSPMMEWMEQFRQDYLKYPEMVVLVPSLSLNPETEMYYQNEEIERYTDDPEKSLFKEPKF